MTSHETKGIRRLFLLNKHKQFFLLNHYGNLLYKKLTYLCIFSTEYFYGLFRQDSALSVASFLTVICDKLSLDAHLFDATIILPV
jgi:hypothetical protein